MRAPTKDLLLKHADLNPTRLSPAEIGRLGKDEVRDEVAKSIAPFRNKLLANFVRMTRREQYRKFMTLAVMGGYQQYLEDLDLSEEALRGKRILDVGAGNREFAANAIRTGVNSEIYSVDPGMDFKMGLVSSLHSTLKKLKIYLRDSIDDDPDLGKLVKLGILTPEQKKLLDDHSKWGVFQDLPFESGSFDMLVAHGSSRFISFKWGENSGPDPVKEFTPEQIERAEKSLYEIRRVLKPGAEARLAPFFSDQISEETLKKFESDGVFDISHESLPDEGGYHPGVQRLILRRRKDRNETISK